MSNDGKDLDKFPKTPALSRIVCKGVGKLIFPNGNIIRGSVLIKILINGRLQVFISLSSKINTDSTFQLECETLTGYKLIGEDLFFSREKTNFNLINYYIYSGFIKKILFRSNNLCYKKCRYVFQLTNFHWNLINTTININNYAIKLRLITPGNLLSQNEIDDVKSSYKSIAISNELTVENVKKSKIKQVDDLISTLVFLMSIANRGYLFPFRKERTSYKDELIFLELEEPAFFDPGWPRQLIHPEHLGFFLESTYNNLQSKNSDYELRIAIDHYLQALTLRSAWSISLGIFTALETINSAFYKKNLDSNKKLHYFWIQDDKKFLENSQLVDGLLQVIKEHYPEISCLQEPEMNSLKSQLRYINRRSYKTRLVYMLKELNVEFTNDMVRAIINIRNKIIHSGVPAFSEDKEFNNKSKKAWVNIQNAACLFERIILSILEYDGKYEPFDYE